MAAIGIILKRVAQAAGERTAFICGDETRTFTQIDETSDRVAALLTSEQIGAGHRVAIIRQNSAEFVEDELGILKAGAAEVLVNPRLTSREQCDLLEDAQPDALFVGEEFADRAGDFERKLDLRVSVVGNDDRQRRLAAAPRFDAPADLPADTIWRLHYSSGTTGRPKAAVLTHLNYLLSVWSYRLTAGRLSSDDRLVTAAPLVSSGGWAFHAHYSVGATSIVLPRFTPADVLEAIERYRATSTFMVPTMIADIVNAEPGRDVFQDLHTLVYSASPINGPVLDRAVSLMGPVLVQAYSMSETMTALSVLSKPDHCNEREEVRRSAGQPSMDVTVRVVGPDDADVPAGSPGRVVLRSGSVMQGYWRRPELTEEVLRDGWLRTSDIGRVDEEGYLHILDRVDDAIIAGGFNVFPGEVEDVMLLHPDVVEIAVIGTPDARLGQLPTAVIRTREGVVADEASLTAHARQYLATYKVPARWEFVKEPLPKNAGGKLLRRELRERFSRALDIHLERGTT